MRKFAGRPKKTAENIKAKKVLAQAKKTGGHEKKGVIPKRKKKQGPTDVPTVPGRKIDNDADLIAGSFIYANAGTQDFPAVINEVTTVTVLVTALIQILFGGKGDPS